jgi:hypothetical protein
MNPTKTGVELMLWKGKKSFKIPKGFSENLNGRTDNTFI